MSDWTPRISSEAGAIYRGLADALAKDIEAGRLRPGDRLLPQRRLAELLEVDLTTVSRGYTEAQSRGLIESQIGRGTFVVDRSKGAGGGGLRLAFTVAPDARGAYRLGQALKTTAVMPPMLSSALMTRWIENGTADLVRDFVRQESATRQAIASEVLEGFDVESQPEALNLWLRLPEGVSRADVVARMQGVPIGILPSDPFVVMGDPSGGRAHLSGRVHRTRGAQGRALAPGQHLWGRLLAWTGRREAASHPRSARVEHCPRATRGIAGRTARSRQ